MWLGAAVTSLASIELAPLLNSIPMRRVWTSRCCTMPVQGLHDDAPSYPPMVETLKHQFLFAPFDEWIGIYLELLCAYLTRIMECGNHASMVAALHNPIRLFPAAPQRVLQRLPTQTACQTVSKVLAKATNSRICVSL